MLLEKEDVNLMKMMKQAFLRKLFASYKKIIVIYVGNKLCYVLVLMFFYLLTEIAVALFFSQGTVPFHGFFIIKLN